LAGERRAAPAVPEPKEAGVPKFPIGPGAALGVVRPPETQAHIEVRQINS
jgi:hypothetical protein